MAGNRESNYFSEDSSLSSSKCSNAEEISPAHIQPYSFEPRFEVDSLEDAEEMPRLVNNLDW